MPRPKKQNRSDGRYEIRRVIGYDADGNRIQKSFYGANKDEALRKFHDYMADIEKHEAEKKRMDFASWVDKWLYTYKEPDVKPTTFNSTYKRPCNNYIIPHFKGRILQDITQIEIKQFLNGLTHRSQSTLDKIVICLNGIFESAIDNDLITKNPCRNVGVKSKAEKQKKRTYDRESTDYLCSSDHKYALYVNILLKMGLRCSELCGLQWKDIDLANRKITIERALTCEGTQIYIDEPKSQNSRRKLDIPEDLQKKLQEAKDILTGSCQKDIGEEFVVIINGHKATPNHFGNRPLTVFYNYMNVPKHQRLTPHELRHTCGTLLYEKTKDIYHVSRFLGHSDIGITTKIYVHSEMQDAPIHITVN